MKNNIFKILVLAVFSTSPLFCYANNTIMIAYSCINIPPIPIPTIPAIPVRAIPLELN